MSISDGARRVMERVGEAAVRSGRRPEDVTLVAVSKTNSVARIRAAYDAGIRVFGENRVQELLEKAEAGAYAGAEIQMIGHLQSNKVRSVVGRVSLIQSAGSESLLAEISKRAQMRQICQDVLIEVNIGDEASKAGVPAGRVPELLEFASGLSGLRVLGLMAIPPIPDGAQSSVRYFIEMEKLFVDMSAKKYDNVTMRILSMGMSGDFEEAINAGATMVRVGSAIFGERA